MVVYSSMTHRHLWVYRGDGRCPALKWKRWPPKAEKNVGQAIPAHSWHAWKCYTTNKWTTEGASVRLCSCCRVFIQKAGCLSAPQHVSHILVEPEGPSMSGEHHWILLRYINSIYVLHTHFVPTCLNTLHAPLHTLCTITPLSLTSTHCTPELCSTVTLQTHPSFTVNDNA